MGETASICSTCRYHDACHRSVCETCIHFRDDITDRYERAEHFHCETPMVQEDDTDVWWCRECGEVQKK